MDSFTTRPDSQWSVSGTTYQVGTSSQISANSATASDSTAVPSSTTSGGTTNGLTTSSQFASFQSGITVAASARTSFLDAQTAFTSYSKSFTSAEDPPDNWSSSGYASTGGTWRTSRTENDTSRATARGSSAQTSSQSSISYQTDTTGSAGSTAGTLSATNSGPATTTRTFSGTVSSYTTETAFVDFSTITTGSTNGFIGVFSTESFTMATTTTSQPSSSWQTVITNLSDQATTYTTAGTDDVTYQNDLTTAGTATTNLRTSYAFGNLIQDTVFLMKANRGPQDVNRGEILWTFSHGAMATDTTTSGPFTALFASTSAGTITVSDYRKFQSSSAAVTAVSISSSVLTITGTGSPTYQSRISSNGLFYSTSTITTTAGTVTGTTTSADTATTYSQSWSLGDIGTLQSTWTIATTTNTAAPASTVSSTVFTHTAYLSGYETLSSGWTSGTTSSTWGFQTSGTSTRPVIFSSGVTTTALSLRSTTVDSILFSSFTSTTSGPATSDTIRVFLGSVSTTTSRFYSTESTFTRATYPADLHSTASQFVVTDSAWHGFTTFTRSESFEITRWTERRLFPHIKARPGHDNIPALDEVRHRCFPLGFAGFGGGFTASALSVHLTTAQGLAAGSTFEGVTITPPATAEAVRGVSFFPVPASASFGGLAGAAATSLLSVPASMTDVISIAATWTSTTGPSSASSVTSRFATHTIGVVSAITGEFWTAEPFTVNSAFRTELAPYYGGTASGGFVAGDNILGNTYQVLARAGQFAWTAFSSTQSTAAAAGSSSGSAGSVAITIPASHAIVFSMEPILTAAWSLDGLHSIFSSTPHPPHS